jgi:hypothetical protein
MLCKSEKNLASEIFLRKIKIIGQRDAEWGS